MLVGLVLSLVAIVFGILGVAGVLFASGRVRLDVTALLVVMALMLTGVLTPRETLAGFGDRSRNPTDRSHSSLRGGQKWVGKRAHRKRRGSAHGYLSGL